ncbi:MAG: LacI family transcriptional regulator [Acholeplasmatales bacterium]|nr:MAG: LacI family transcriptional regulator [Acholeplasmatales bacterium]
MAKITLEMIAKELGVSKVAVHKALHDKKGVSESLRTKIKAYAKSVNYVPRNASVELTKKRFMYFVNQDFFLTPSEQFYSTIFYFLSAECNQINSLLQVAFFDPDYPAQKMQATIDAFQPDGLFFAGQVNERLMSEIGSLSIPLVFIDHFSPFFSANYVRTDNFQNSYRLTRYLLDHGHRTIGFIGNIDATDSIADRYYGYLKALRLHGIEPLDGWHINCNVERETDPANFSVATLPTAYVCHCDAAAQWLYTALSLKGMKVPEDLSVVSFDNTPICENLMPKLTSIGPDKQMFAKRAFETMLDALKHPKRLHKHLVETPLVKRESVGTLS